MKINSFILINTWQRSAQASSVGSASAVAARSFPSRCPARKARLALSFLSLSAGGRARRDRACPRRSRVDRAGSAVRRLAQSLGFADDQRVVHQGERLGGHVRDVSPAHRRERHGCIEGEEHRVQEIAPDVQVDAPPAVAVEGARSTGPAAAFHVARQVNGHARSIHHRLELAGNGQEGIADRFGFEPPNIHPVQEGVGGVDLLGGGVRERSTSDTCSRSASAGASP